jgi:hypothetical protein
MLMRYIFIITNILALSNAMALKPSNCSAALENLFANLVIKNKLDKPSNMEPDENYKYKQHPNICVIPGSVSENAKWVVHKHKNGVDVIFQLTSFQPFSKSFYGPFKSAYNK